MKVECPKCGSKDVEKGASSGAISFGLFIAGSCCLFGAIFFWPMIYLAGLLFLGGIALTVITILNKATKQTNNNWACKKCHHVFSYDLEEVALNK